MDKILNKLELIDLYRNETQEKKLSDINGNLIKQYSFTDRAILAQNKILLRDTIGQGSYSKVKEAYDFKNLRQIAVKIIDCTKAPKDFLEKFMPRELNIWPKIEHPYVIQMYNYFLNENKIFMILEYANGGDMLNYIQKIRGPIPEIDCKVWMKQICLAVQYLHQIGIIHRDLKLENLLIDSNRNIKLCDFGFSKDVSNLSTDELCKTYCGSKAYASPEILIGLPYDAKKADVWAIGVIFFIFLTGNMPFKEDTCNQIILNQHKSLKFFGIKNSKISILAKNLVKWIFTFEWKKRPDITDILSYEWFSKKENTLIGSEYNLRSKFKSVKRIDEKNFHLSCGK